VLLIAGGVANAIFASDNTDSYNRLKPCDVLKCTQKKNFCVDIKWFRDSEIAAAVSCYKPTYTLELCHGVNMIDMHI